MKTAIYESAVIINATLEDSIIESQINKIKEFISNNGGSITDLENWGRKRLAYPIDKNKIGYYVIFRFSAPSNLLAKLERFYNLDENILRYLTIKLNKYALEQIEKNKIQSTSSKEETASFDNNQIEAGIKNEDNG
ncbi:MAG: 30S ribosomal protein S6 [Ignavibacterium sp.]|nr:30S ribosomal protein S6 [Ignavibacterium sp.]MCX7610010.1 30S ribosomal protein S6 [Ignavibacterium sp.]MDW8375018.1 30S ribosomal protein S6 [Ignavibacteriales bacterium]